MFRADNVFWSVPDPDPGCKILILKRVGQQQPSLSECGNVVLAVDQAGCYETPALQNDFMLQYCCGNDCYNATGEYRAKRALERSPLVVSLVDTALDSVEDKKLDAEHGTLGENLMPSYEDPAAVALEKRSQSDPKVDELARDLSPEPSALLIEPRRRHRKKPKFHCDKPQDLGAIFTKAGRQTRLTDNLQCGACGDCSRVVSSTVQVSHSIINTKTTTYSDSESMDVSMEAGGMLLSTLHSFRTSPPLTYP